MNTNSTNNMKDNIIRVPDDNKNKNIRKKRKWIFLLTIPGFVLILNNGCEKNDGGDSNINEVHTTSDRTIIPDTVPSSSPILKPSDDSLFSQYGYGKWHYGAGLPREKRLDLMPAGYDYASATNAAKLLRFFTITDIHITDKESPAQAIFFSPYAGPNGI
jgi:hypothetical protein